MYMQRLESLESYILYISAVPPSYVLVTVTIFPFTEALVNCES
jgi:hypothetical protein